MILNLDLNVLDHITMILDPDLTLGSMPTLVRTGDFRYSDILILIYNPGNKTLLDHMKICIQTTYF